MKKILSPLLILAIAAIASAGVETSYSIPEDFQGTWVLNSTSTDKKTLHKEEAGTVIGTVYAAKIILASGEQVQIHRIVSLKKIGKQQTDLLTLVVFESGVVWSISSFKQNIRGVAMVIVYQNETKLKAGQESSRLIVEIH